jgi:hypothetical protein
MRRRIATGALALLVLAGCGQDRGDIGRGPECAANLDAGYRELNRAEADGLSGTVKWGKAASLLGAAKIQQQFEEYGNCSIKAQEARRYLREMGY